MFGKEQIVSLTAEFILNQKTKFKSMTNANSLKGETAYKFVHIPFQISSESDFVQIYDCF